MLLLKQMQKPPGKIMPRNHCGLLLGRGGGGGEGGRKVRGFFDCDTIKFT